MDHNPNPTPNPHFNPKLHPNPNPTPNLNPLWSVVVRYRPLWCVVVNSYTNKNTSGLHVITVCDHCPLVKPRSYETRPLLDRSHLHCE